MGGRHLTWLARACVAGLVLLLGGDAGGSGRQRSVSVHHAASESLLVAVGPGAPARRSLTAPPSHPARPARRAPVEPPDDLQAPEPEPPERPAARPTLQALQPCETELWLAGSVVNEARPRLSLAVVRRPAGTAVVALGGRIDDFTVVAIEPARAALQTADGAHCALSAVSAGTKGVALPLSPAAAPPPSEAHDKPPPGKPVFAQAELAAGVRPLGDGRYLIARPLLLKALANPGGAAGGAWFRLFERDGRRVGMEMRAVREGSALHAMGMQTGDVARSVNGMTLDTPDGLIGALRAARESDSVTIAILRDGQASELRYTID